MAEQTKKEINLASIKKFVIHKCLTDSKFKEKLMKNAKEALQGELNVKLPENFQLKVLEDTDQTCYVVLPSKKEIASGNTDDYELSEQELQAIAGGATRRRGGSSDSFTDIDNPNVPH